MAQLLQPLQYETSLCIGGAYQGLGGAKPPQFKKMCGRVLN